MGFSVQDVALFLRLLYDTRWQSTMAGTFGALHASLAALLRLAHQLEAQQLLSALCGYMAGAPGDRWRLAWVWHPSACT